VLWILAVVGLAWAEPTSESTPGPSLCPDAVAAGWRAQDGALFSARELNRRDEIDFPTIWAFDQLAGKLLAQGATVVVVLVPTRAVVLGQQLAEVDPTVDWHEMAASYQGARHLLEASGLIVPDLLKVALELGDDPEAFFRKTDPHWSHTGARASAQAVAEAIAELPVSSLLGQQTFETTPAYVVRAFEKGGWSRQVEELCGAPRFTEQVHILRTTELAPAALGLLDEPPVPLVTLLAASYGQPAFGFPGFLSEALGSSVLPVAVSGGQIFSPLRAYLGSAEYDGNMSPLVVWVMDPGHLSVTRNLRTPGFREPTSHRQLQAAVHGPCDAGRAVASTEQDVGPGTTPLLVELDHVAAADHYLQLTAPALQGTAFDLEIRYTNGLQERVEVRPDLRTTQGPLRYVSFHDVVPANVSNIALVLPPGAPKGTVTATVCAVP
jgi:hypothetical protein